MRALLIPYMPVLLLYIISSIIYYFLLFVSFLKRNQIILITILMLCKELNVLTHRAGKLCLGASNS